MILTQEKVHPHVLWAKIHRPEALNAIDYDVMEKMEQLVEQIEGDDDIRVFILSGAGDQAFVSGGDLKKFHSIKSKEEAIAKAKRMQKLLHRIELMPCWNVAHINGDAFGGGIELMLAFDFRLSIAEAKFGFTQGRFYLTPGWGGLTRLVEKVGRAKALEWLGKAEIKPADEVLKFGLIEHILNGKNPEKETLKWAEKLTLNDRKFIKTLKDGAMRLSENRLKALEAEVQPFSELWVDEQHVSRVEKFMNRDS
jgi:enoyl-CoA hydratase/carnithine racemase